MKEKNRSSWIEEDGIQLELQEKEEEIQRLMYARQDIVLEFEDIADMLEFKSVYTDNEISKLKRKLLEKNDEEIVEVVYDFMWYYTEQWLTKPKKKIRWD